jgi:hypothetical protein
MTEQAISPLRRRMIEDMITRRRSQPLAICKLGAKIQYDHKATYRHPLR